MMRKFLLAILLVPFLLTSCCKDKTLNITGEWSLISVETRAVTIGGEQVDVYIAFNADKSFQIYQMLGTGRYRLYTGTWSLLDGVLSGKYSDGTPWGASYDVELESSDTILKLTSKSAVAEVDTYKKTPIPDSVKSNVLLPE